MNSKMQLETKYKTLEEAKKLREQVRSQGKTLVALSGSFDMLHEGHQAYLKAARSEGDVLLVLLNSDASVRLYKGPQRPFLPEKERAQALAELDDVDIIVLFDDITPVAMLTELQPDVYCNGPDWGVDSIERPVVEGYGGKMSIPSVPKMNHSSKIIEKVRGAGAAKDTRAIFLDRDGTLIDDVGYLHSIADVRMLPGVIEGLTKLSKAGYKFYIITNQSGIGRGMYSEADMQKVNDFLIKEFAQAHVPIAGVYFCPHKPNDGCGCRKPGAELILKAAQEHGLTLNGSWMIGDKCSDVLAGKNTNLQTIKIGKELCEPIGAHHYVESFEEISDIILNNE